MDKYSVEIEGDERILKIETDEYLPSLEDDEICFARTIDKLIEAGKVTQIVFVSDRNYIYPYEQVRMLNEIRDIFVELVRERKLMRALDLGPEARKCLGDAPTFIKYLLLEQLRKDPIGAYVRAKRRLNLVKAELRLKKECAKYLTKYVYVLEEIVSRLENSELIRRIENELVGYEVGDRSIYRKIFAPSIRPNFVYTRLVIEPPKDGIEIDSYYLGEVPVTIYKIPGKSRYFYHIVPEEYQLNEDEYLILGDARDILARHRSIVKEFIDPEMMRETFYHLGYDLIEDIANYKKIKLSGKQIDKLAKLLVKLTVGFGIIEALLGDKYIEDIYINSPIGKTPIFINHNLYGECESNIIPNIREIEAWISRFRFISGRPLDEAHPVLDTEIILKNAWGRVAIVQRPLSPRGYSIAIRRHREKPWTLPLFIKNRMINSLAGGLLWFLVDGARTMLIAGTRGAGKTSLLSSLMIQILRKYRIITVEDTLELPTSYMVKLGFDILPLKVRSAIVGEMFEMSAEDGIRTSLRLGDSSLIVGEVRSTEARALYEAMRVGALANVVAGTIHGDSPYGVFDRVVNDLKVPRTSFKATDIIIIANKVKSPDLLKEYRRVMQITEVRKDWENDPLKEGGFVNLFEYDAKSDSLIPTKYLLEGESEIIKAIGSRVREWVGNWEKIWENIELRANILSLIVKYGEKNPNLLEADFVVKANDKFHSIIEELKEEIGYPEKREVVKKFEEWIQNEGR